MLGLLEASFLLCPLGPAEHRPILHPPITWKAAYPQQGCSCQGPLFWVLAQAALAAISRSIGALKAFFSASQ